MKISVLVTSRNRAHVLKRCIESVLAQDYGDYDILILDDASDDRIAYLQILKEFDDPRIKLIRSEVHLGVSGGRNTLMRQAIGDIFFVIDDDAYFDNEASLSKTVHIFSEKSDVGIIACKILNHKVSEKPYLVPFSYKIVKKNPEVLEKSQYVGYFLGGAHAIRREVISTCGDYNANLFFGEEELDLSYRVISKGWKIWYEPSIVVHHVPQSSVINKGQYGELYHHVKNRFYLAWRYLPWKYMIPYLVLWLGKYFWNAIKHKSLTAYVKGILAGIQNIKNIRRESLNVEAIEYLKKHFGRLWY